ncbi:MAG: RNA-binding cell elongation regulator Jag/EloR [Chloroflexota bacterium]
MSEKATLEVIAPTVEEALSKGLAELGLPAEAVSMEVLDAGSKGFLGLGGRQVRIRLTVKGPEEEPAPAKAERPAPRPQAAKPQPRPEPKPAPKPETKAEAAPETGTEAPVSGQDPAVRLAEETLSTLLEKMKVKASVSAQRDDSDSDRAVIRVDIRGDDLGVLIGRRAETLNALQYVTSLIVGKQLEQWVQVTVDVEGYRSRRERQLRQMARRMADQATRSGRQQTLEPMPAAERRIIHLELRNNPQVETQSVGEEPTRKVTIIPKQ